MQRLKFNYFKKKEISRKSGNADVRWPIWPWIHALRRVTIRNKKSAQKQIETKVADVLANF